LQQAETAASTTKAETLANAAGTPKPHATKVATAAATSLIPVITKRYCLGLILAYFICSFKCF